MTFDAKPARFMKIGNTFYWNLSPAYLRAAGESRTVTNQDGKWEEFRTSEGSGDAAERAIIKQLERVFPPFFNLHKLVVYNWKRLSIAGSGTVMGQPVTVLSSAPGQGVKSATFDISANDPPYLVRSQVAYKNGVTAEVTYYGFNQRERISPPTSATILTPSTN